MQFKHQVFRKWRGNWPDWYFEITVDKKELLQKEILSKKMSVLLNKHVFTNVKCQIIFPKR